MKKDFVAVFVCTILVVVFCAVVINGAPTDSVYLKAPVYVAERISFNTTGVDYALSGRNDSEYAYAVVDCLDNTFNCQKLKDEIASKAGAFTVYKNITDTADADYQFVNPATPTPTN